MRSIPVLLAISSAAMMLAPLACGKYASPQRVAQWQPREPVAANAAGLQQARDGSAEDGTEDNTEDNAKDSTKDNPSPGIDSDE